MLLAFWWPSPLRAKSICNRLRYFIPINNCLFQTLGCYFKQRTELDVHHRKCSQPSRRLLDHVPRLPTILKMNIFTGQWPVKKTKLRTCLVGQTILCECQTQNQINQIVLLLGQVKTTLPVGFGQKVISRDLLSNYTLKSSRS